MLGIVLLTVTFLLSFTGYLLPWDQLAYWAITVGAEMGGSTPLIGKQVNIALLGGFQIGQPTLIRWYTLHVIFLPLTLIVLVSMHFWRVRKDGNISTPVYAAPPEDTPGEVVGGGDDAPQPRPRLEAAESDEAESECLRSPGPPQVPRRCETLVVITSTRAKCGQGGNDAHGTCYATRRRRKGH